MISRKAKTSIRRKSWQTSRWNWNWNNEEARVWVLDKKKQTGIAPFSFLRCKFGGKIGGERGGSVHVSPMSTHDRSCVGRGINMKSCRLIYDPGRPLLDLWRYSPPLHLRKTSALFSICRDASLHGAESLVKQPLSPILSFQFMLFFFFF